MQSHFGTISALTCFCKSKLLILFKLLQPKQFLCHIIFTDDVFLFFFTLTSILFYVCRQSYGKKKKQNVHMEIQLLAMQPQFAAM